MRLPRGARRVAVVSRPDSPHSVTTAMPGGLAMRVSASAAKSGLSSMPSQLRWSCSAATAVVPLPRKGSRTRPGFMWRSAVTRRCECCPHRCATEGANHPPTPRQPAASAARLWTAGLDCSAYQTDWKDRVVTGNGTCRDLPDVTRILAERMADAPLRFERSEARCFHAVGAAPGLPNHSLPLLGASRCRGSPMRCTDGVEIEEVLWLARQDIDYFVGAVKPVGDAARNGVGLAQTILLRMIQPES